MVKRKGDYCIGEPVEVCLKEIGIVKGKVIDIKDDSTFNGDGLKFYHLSYLIEFIYKKHKLKKWIPHSPSMFRSVWIRSLL